MSDSEQNFLSPLFFAGLGLVDKFQVEKTEHVRSEKRQIEGGMGGTKMTIKTRKGLKIPLLCQEKTEHVRSLPLKNGAC